MTGKWTINWRRVFRATGVVVVLVILLFGLTSWILFRQRNTLVLEQMQSYLQQSQSGELTVGRVDLRLFRNFPDLTIELDNIQYYERRDSLREPGELPILHADRVYVALGLWPLVNGEVEVAEVSIDDGELNLVEDAHGQTNLTHALARPTHPAKPVVKAPAVKPAPPSPPQSSKKPTATPPAKRQLQVNLEALAIRNVRITWQPYGLVDRNAIQLESVDVKLSPEDEWTGLSVQSQLVADTVQWGARQLPQGEVSFDAEGKFKLSTGQLFIDRSRLSLDIFNLSVSGTYEHQHQRKLDIVVVATSNDLPLLEKLMKPDALKENRDLLRSGEFFLNGHVFGDLEKPRFDVSFGARKISFRIPGATGSFKNLGFEGQLSSGVAPDYSGATLRLSQLNGQVPGGYIRGEVAISNLVRPWLTCSLQTKLQVDRFDKVFRLDQVQDLRGNMTANIRYDGPARWPRPGWNEPRASFDMSFAVDQLSFLVPGMPEGFRDIHLDGTFKSGASPDHSQAVLDVPEFRAVVPGGRMAGKIHLDNLNEPVLNYRLQAQVDLAGYEKIFGFGFLRDLKGKASADLRFDGPLKLIGTHAMDSSRSSALRFDSVSFEVVRNRKVVRSFSGHLINQNNQADVELSLRYGESDLHLKGNMENLMHRIFRNERLLEATGSISSSQLFTRDFLFDSVRIPQVDDRISELSLDFALSNLLPPEDADAREQAFEFTIRNLAAHLDKLPDIRKLNVMGNFHRSPTGIRLGLSSCNLLLPEGGLQLSGNLLIPEKRELRTDAKIKLSNFPWAYVSEVVDEFKEGKEPIRKQQPAAEMDRVDGELDVSAVIRTYPFDFHKLEIRDSRLTYLPQNGSAYRIGNLDATFQPLYFNHPINGGSILGLRTVRGTARLEKLSIPGIIDLNLTLEATGKDDTLQLDFVSASRKAKSETGLLFLDLSGKETVLNLRYEVVSTPVDALVSKFAKKDYLKGNISYTVDLHTAGSSWSDINRNLSGSIDIRGDSLDLAGIDVDDVLTKFEKSQKFNLTDLGAVVLIGPVGIVATKGSNFVALATIDVSSQRHTAIQQLVARWKLDHQVLQTTDVAFATPKNRIAINGAIDFARDSIPGIQVAVVDKNGCSLMDQKLYGKFSAVQTGKLNVAKTLLGSVINFVDAMVGKDCQPVYTGSVKDPKTAASK